MGELTGKGDRCEVYLELWHVICGAAKGRTCFEVSVESRGLFPVCQALMMKEEDKGKLKPVAPRPQVSVKRMPGK